MMERKRYVGEKAMGDNILVYICMAGVGASVATKKKEEKCMVMSR